MEELDKQIEQDAIDEANNAVAEARQEREIERQLREKQNDYDDIVSAMANLIIEDNEASLGEDVAEAAKQKIAEKKNTKRKSKTKEVEENGKEKVKRAGRPRKSA